ncbi:MAG: response regulator [Chloroflexi bacterium]|nr:response regulator [Chloroflexota bacterium]
MKRNGIIWWTFLGLTVTTLAIGGLGGVLLLRNVERSYLEIQVKANAEQAVRLAGVLEQELASGQPASSVEERLQNSLLASPHDAGGFLCLLGGSGRVICHPDPKAVGMQMTDALILDLQGKKAKTIGDRLASREGGAGLLRGQTYLSDTHIIFQQPVKGTGWLVSVHSDFGLITQRIALLRKRILRVVIPVLGLLIVAGTLVARAVARRYENRIETANAELENRVAERTAELAAALLRYRSLFHGAPVAILVYGSDGVILEANVNCAILCDTPLETLVGRNVSEFAPEFAELALSQSQLPAADEQVSTWEGLLRRPNGVERDIRGSKRAIQEKSQTLILAVVNDVTEQKQLEAALRQSQKMEAFGQLAGGIAHDFNNLLTAINGFAQMARSSLDEALPANRFVTEILKAGERARNLTGQILAFSRKQQLQPRVVSLNDLVKGIIQMLQRIIGERILIRMDLDENLWAVMVDPGQMEQVLLNLAVNARDAMPEGGALTIQTFNQRSINGADGVVLSVSDTGCGIPETVKPRIFEPFFTTKERGKGTGLGLATVHGIVKQHGGDIQLESDIKRGTTFFIFLPRTGSEGSSPLLRETDATRGNGEYILVVEDDPAVLEVARLQLQKLGYRVFSATNGSEAVDIVDRHNNTIQMVLSDVTMPGLTIYELTRHLKDLKPDLRIAYMTGYAADPGFSTFVIEQDAAVLQKPFTAFTLADTVRRTLNRVEVGQANHSALLPRLSSDEAASPRFTTLTSHLQNQN